jgi:hypothetical protein
MATKALFWPVGRQVRDYDLRLASGKVVTQHGCDGEDAARRYVDSHGGAVVATREHRWPADVVQGPINIIE